MAAVHLLLLLTLSLFSVSISESDKEALIKLKKSFTNVKALDSWNSDSSPCINKWTGVICNGKGNITGLHLTNLGLSGTIDIVALLEIPGLRTLSFSRNSFSGSIPEFNKLGALKSLLLSFNQFSGEIANDYFSQMSSLKKFWLTNNTCTGKIPDSLSNLSNLIELHLEGNQFSGSIPSLNQSSLKSLDLSNNKLEGEIPSNLSKFAAASFAGNADLCGAPLETECEKTTSAVKTSLGIGLLLVFVAVLILGCIVASANRREEYVSMPKENMDEVVEVRVAAYSGSSRKASESSRRNGSSTKRGSQHGKNNNMGDLVMVNDEKGTFGLQDLMKAAAEVLGNGGLGSAYKAVMTTGLSVVVKRMREMNRMEKDDFENEMRHLGRLRHRNILTPLAYHHRKEEKLVVSEYVPKGSLLYVLHGDRGICHAELNWQTRLNIVRGIASGMGFLHSEFSSYDLPHGNLKSSNVLLKDNCEPLLTDYAFHPLTNPNQAVQSMLAYKSPEYLQDNQVSPKSDVYCLGIIILEILTGKFPSQYLSAGKGGIDVVEFVRTAISEGREAELIDPEILTGTNSVEQMTKLIHIGAHCAESSPSHRPDMSEAIRRIEEVQL